ncbi:MAG: alginate lyase family protein [Desulfomonilaceae bacterium]
MAEPFQRAGSWIRHWNERRNLYSDPLSMSTERVFARRSEWLLGNPDQNLSETVTKSLMETLPASWWQDPSYWGNFSKLYPEQVKNLVREAESILAGKLRLFQWKEIELLRPIRWSATMAPDEPDEQWPRTYYADIDVYHDPTRPERDIKWCWELNRFQHLLCLGASWRLTGNESFAREARDHVESWMNSIRYPLGVQWSSNLEVGLRLLAWIRCHILCANCAVWDDDFVKRFITCVYIHTRHLARELTTHHAPGNHLLGEASALLYVSVIYPFFADSGKWGATAVRILDRLVPMIILRDGVYAEQSTGYFRFVAEFLLPVIHLTKYNGIALSGEVLQRVAAGLEFVHEIANDSVEVPMIGDSDTGRAVRWQLSDFWDFSWLLAAGGVLLDRPSLFSGMESFPAESFLMVGEDGLESFAKNKLKRISNGNYDKNARGIIDFPDGGYQISRDGQFSILFDAGPLGIPPGCGHGHADGLSFLLWHKGQPVVVDTGTGSYNAQPVWRDYFRSTAAHNTIRVDGKNQTQPLNTFRWAELLKIKQYSPRAGESWRVLHGKLDWRGIVHHRFIIHALEQGVLVLDHIDGSGVHDLDLSMHFDPVWNIDETSAGLFSAWSLNERIEISIKPNSEGRKSILRASIGPVAGWNSRYYGFIIPAATLRATMRCELPANVLVKFTPPGQDIHALENIADEIFPPGVFDFLLSGVGPADNTDS